MSFDSNMLLLYSPAYYDWTPKDPDLTTRKPSDFLEDALQFLLTSFQIVSVLPVRISLVDGMSQQMLFKCNLDCITFGSIMFDVTNCIAVQTYSKQSLKFIYVVKQPHLACCLSCRMKWLMTSVFIWYNMWLIFWSTVCSVTRYLGTLVNSILCALLWQTCFNMHVIVMHEHGHAWTCFSHACHCYCRCQEWVLKGWKCLISMLEDVKVSMLYLTTFTLFCVHCQVLSRLMLPCLFLGWNQLRIVPKLTSETPSLPASDRSVKWHILWLSRWCSHT